MEDWKYEPARDLGLRAHERRLSLRREVGLISASACMAWRGITKGYLMLAHQLTIHGQENLRLPPPFVLVANHASHLDAVILADALPTHYVGRVFSIAAGDTFFTKPATSIFATAFMNALPIWRNSCGTHSLDELRARLTSGNCVYIIFPEGTRTRDGAMKPFTPGIGRLVAGTTLPVVPCYLHGTFRALPAGRSLPRPGKVSAIIGRPLQFESAKNDRSGWDRIAASLEEAVRSLKARRFSGSATP